MKALTERQLIDLAGLVNLLAAVAAQKGVCSKIRVIELESVPVVEKLWNEWSEYVPDVTLTIEPHRYLPEMRVVVARREGPALDTPPLARRATAG